MQTVRILVDNSQTSGMLAPYFYISRIAAAVSHLTKSFDASATRLVKLHQRQRFVDIKYFRRNYMSARSFIFNALTPLRRERRR